MRLTTPPQRVSLAVTGASGIPYTLRLLEMLLNAGVEIYFMMSSAAHQVVAMETDLKLPKQAAYATQRWGKLLQQRKSCRSANGPK